MYIQLTLLYFSPRLRSMDGERTGGYDQHIRVSYCTDRIERINLTFISLMFKHVESFFKMGRGDVQRESFPEK